MPTSEVAAAREVLGLYPRIYFACHTRHVRDPQSGRLLSRHQASVLDHLDEVDPITLNGLSRHMGVTPGTMSLTIDRLERKGYVVRLRDVADRRRVLQPWSAARARAGGCERRTPGCSRPSRSGGWSARSCAGQLPISPGR